MLFMLPKVAVLKQEKEILSSAERRACAEVQSLSERIYRLQVKCHTYLHNFNVTICVGLKRSPLKVICIDCLLVT